MNIRLVYSRKAGGKKPPKRKQTDEDAEEGRLDAKMRYDHDDDLGVKDGLLGSARGLEGKTFGELLEKLSQQMSEFIVSQMDMKIYRLESHRAWRRPVDSAPPKAVIKLIDRSRGCL